MSVALDDAEALRLRDPLRRRELASFVAGAMQVLVPGERYQDNYHVAAISYALEQVAAGKTPRLIVTCPPRHLKSLIASVCFPAWLLGNHPRAKIVCVSHTADLAVKHHNDFRRLIASPYYRNLFAGTVAARDKNTETEFRTTAGGERYSTSVGGPITGRGGRIIIMDDPTKAEDAHSETKREATKDWYRKTLVTRRDDPKNSATVLVMQRLHEDDLVAHLKEEGVWSHLNLPAIAEQDERIQIGPHCYHHRREGDLLHAARLPQDELDRIKAAMGAADFSAQYQQRPAPLEGAVIKRTWLKRYAREPERKRSDQIVQCWDMGVKAGPQNDYSVCVTVLKRGNEHYLVHVLRERLEFAELLKRVAAHRRTFGPGPLLIEDAAAGTQILQALKADFRLPSAIALKADTDKLSRLAGQSYKFESGWVFLPESAPWLAEFEAELLAFPKSRHDDQVDAIAHYLRWSDRSGRPVGNGPRAELV